MANSLLYINEKASTTLGLTFSHPVTLCMADRGNKILPQHLVPATPLSRYRRCFRYLDCFGNGYHRARYASHKRVNQCCQPGGSPGTLPKAVYLSSQFDRKTDCFRPGILLRGGKPTAGTGAKNWPQIISERRIKRPTGDADTLDVSGVWSKAVCGTQTRHGGTVNKDQPCSQNLVLSGALMRFDPNGQRRKSVQRVDIAGPLKIIWQKPGIGVRPSDRSSSLMALPKGKDNRVLSLMTPRASMLKAGKTTYQAMSAYNIKVQ